jgi:c-di-GMP-binding flagellar brake protein YcgR
MGFDVPVWNLTCTLIMVGDDVYVCKIGDQGKMTERRTARRYDLSLPIIIRIPVEKETSPRSGKTRDISTRGLYFTIDQDPGAGAELDITLTLPSEVTRGSEVFIRATGKVVRVDKRHEDGNSRVGVAAVIERYEIIRNEPVTH